MKNSLSTMSILFLMSVLICAVLGALSTASASSDLRRAQKQAEYAAAMQSCENEAQDWLSMIASAKSSDGNYKNEFSDGEGHSLTVEISVSKGNITICRWQRSTEWTDEKALGSLVHID